LAIDVQFVYPTADHAQALVDDLRLQDAAEMAALGFVSPAALRRMVDTSVNTSMFKATILLDGKVACIFGVAPVNIVAGIGAVWALGTEHGQPRAGALTHLSRPYIAEMLAHFPLLINMVHAENTGSRRWLKKLGATFKDPVTVASGATFIPFEMRADHV